MSVFEMAKKYYPRLWSRNRIEALLEAGKLTPEEAREILGETDSDADERAEEGKS